MRFRLAFLVFGVIIIGTGCSSEAEAELKAFTSDGCSSFPDGTLKQKQLWLSCCIEHDKAYWLGGSYAQRVLADKELKLCVEQVGEKAVAQLMLAGVRVGGSPYWPTSFRWGYGWGYFRGYEVPSSQERALAEQLLKAYEANLKAAKKK